MSNAPEHMELAIKEGDHVEISKVEGELLEGQGNILRRHIVENPKKKKLSKHRLWMESLQHEYPMPYVPYRIGVYIRYYNQTRHQNYLEKHIQQFSDDIAICKRWTLVDFYIDKGMTAPHMEFSAEWCRLLGDCFSGKVNLIVTQKVSNVSNDPEEMALIARLLAAQNPPIGIYFISEDIFTLASYYREDLHDKGFFPPGWRFLPEDELDMPLLNMAQETQLLGASQEMHGSERADVSASIGNSADEGADA